MRWPNETTPSEFNGGERMFLFLPSPQNILDDKYSSKCHFNFPFFLCLCHILLVCRRWSAVVVVSVVDTRSLFFFHCVSFFFSFFFVCWLVRCMWRQCWHSRDGESKKSPAQQICLLSDIYRPIRAWLWHSVHSIPVYCALCAPDSVGNSPPTDTNAMCV